MDVLRRLSALALGLSIACAPEGDDPEVVPPTFTELRERVLTPSCVFAACHKGASPAGGLGLEGDAHAALVDAPSTALPDRTLVVPGVPEDSYLLEKLESSMPGAGDPMPPTASLSEERLDLVRSWIEAGARED